MMKKAVILTSLIGLMVATIGCNEVRRDTGKVYMPDMSYSRALETYSSTEALTQAGIKL